MVDPTVWVAIITLVGTLVGSFGGIVTASKLTNYRIVELEKKVDKHNNIVEKTFLLEQNQGKIQKDLDLLGEDHEQLKKEVNSINTRVTVLEKGRG